MSDQPTKLHVLDRPVARVGAGCVLLAALAALAAIHWDTLSPEDQPLAPVESEGPFARCFEERRLQIDRMITDFPDMAGRRGQFLAQAEGLCRDQHSDNTR